MKILLKLLILTTLVTSLQAGFFSDLFESITKSNKASEDVRVDEEEYSVDDFQNIEEEKVFSSDEDDSFEDPTTYIKEKKIFLSYLKYPKRLYINQHFIVELKAVVIEDELKSLTTLFVNGKDFKVINPTSAWRKVDDKSYINRFYFKLTSKDSKIPTIRVVSTNANNKKYKEDIAPPAIKLIKLKDSEFFSGIIAKDLKVISHKEKRYDDKSNLVLMEVNATMSNLEDFHLSFALREALDSLKDNLDYQSMYYVSVVPNYQKEFKFKYFNLKSNSVNKVSFPIILADATLSTQIGLNPQKSKFFLYKIIAYFAISFIFLLLYLKYRHISLLFISALIAFFILYTKLLSGSLTLDKGVNIRILPTNNSTVFFKTSKKIDAKILLKKDGYTKLLLPNGKIGWIKDDDLSKN
jgi:hypothetical protein